MCSEVLGFIRLPHPVVKSTSLMIPINVRRINSAVTEVESLTYPRSLETRKIRTDFVFRIVVVLFNCEFCARRVSDLCRVAQDFRSLIRTVQEYSDQYFRFTGAENRVLLSPFATEIRADDAIGSPLNPRQIFGSSRCDGRLSGG